MTFYYYFQIDIREPLSHLRTALEKKLGQNLSDYEFWLQDSQKLPSTTTLVDQCIQGEGVVQVIVEIFKCQMYIDIGMYIDR